MPTTVEVPPQVNTESIDFTLGMTKSPELSLLGDFRQLVNSVAENPLFSKENPVLVLSPLAATMIRDIAAQANAVGKEFAFSLRGVEVQGENNKMFVSSYAVPSSDFSVAQTALVNTTPDIEKNYATYLAQQTNLTSYFQEKTGYPRGNMHTTGHVHHAKLGEHVWGTPSAGDYAQMEKSLDEDPTLTELNMIVVTRKPDGVMTYTAIRSHRDEAKKITHELMPIIEPYGKIEKGMLFKMFK